MKKLIIVAAFILLAGVAFSQTLQKGNLIGLHVMTVNLNPDVSSNQFIDFYVNKYKPEFEKNFPGVKWFIAKGIRGENDNKFAFIFYFESEKDRNKYFNEDTSLTELGKSAFEKLQPTTEEATKLGTLNRTFTDWVIQ